MKKKPPHRRWILVTGLSGSGKSTALKILEDQGFFAIDNLPVALLPSLVQMLRPSKTHFPRVALGMDAREKGFLNYHAQVLQALADSGVEPEVLFLDSSEKVLIRRFSESRRPHPLGKQGSLAQAIAEEKHRLQRLKKIATKVLDSSGMSVHDLKKALKNYLHPQKPVPAYSITLISFGFKHGIPAETDLFFDVRFLDNPYFVPRLKNLDGRSRSVKNYVLKQKDAKIFLRHLMSFLKFLLPRYQKEGKNHLTVALGCTGGKHRSVALAEELRLLLKRKGWETATLHRDLGKKD